ncbi:MAG: diguanylate cyclase [Burkholderiales bacterium]
MRTPQPLSFLPLRSGAASGAADRAPTTGVEDGRRGDLRFVQRTHRMRALGLGLGGIAVAAVLFRHNAGIGWWLVLLANALVWPHVAWWRARRSARPRISEMHNLLLDSALGGMWVAVMQFNLLPSVLVVTMLAVDKVSVGGPPLLMRTFMLQAVVCALTWALLGFPLDVVTPMPVLVACMPFLAVYPVAISNVAFVLASRVAQQNRRLEEMGRTDGLTGLANRRKLFAVAEAELVRYRRTGRPLALLVIDVDRFKRINDRFGHPAGDEVLCGVADVLRRCSRASDTPARYGGDEFIVVLPETDLHGAEEVAQRIRRQLDEMEFERAPGFKCTVSVGAAEASLDITDVDEWIQHADAALYRAKGAGRDRFVAQVAPVPRRRPVHAAGD